MKRGGLLLGGLAAVVITLMLIVGAPRAQASPDHESTSDAADGTSALWYFARASGHPTDRIEGSFELPERGILFVFSPDRGNAYTSDDAGSLARWVRAGGVLVYASEQGDPELDSAFHLSRVRGPANGRGTASAPVLGGVRNVSGSEPVYPFRLAPNQVGWVRSTEGEPLLLSATEGKGRLVALADPSLLVNDHLERADNGRLAADLLELAGAGSLVVFDEYHHGVAGAGGGSPADFLLTRWGDALGLALLFFLVGVLMRSRSFGPRLPLAPSATRSSAEYATAVGALLRRSGARSLTLQVLDSAARRALAQRLGIGSPAGPGFDEVLRQRAPALALELGQAESELVHADQSEHALLRAAKRLHGLSYPLAETQEVRPR